MNFNLQDFEGHIDKKLINSGRNYWLNDYLSPFNCDGMGKWHTVTRHKTFLHIFIVIKPENNNQILNCYCGCVRNSYICKHIVAALFGLRAELSKDKLSQSDSYH